MRSCLLLPEALRLQSSSRSGVSSLFVQHLPVSCEGGSLKPRARSNQFYDMTLLRECQLQTWHWRKSKKCDRDCPRHTELSPFPVRTCNFGKVATNDPTWPGWGGGWSGKALLKTGPGCPRLRDSPSARPCDGEQRASLRRSRSSLVRARG